MCEDGRSTFHYRIRSGARFGEVLLMCNTARCMRDDCMIPLPESRLVCIQSLVLQKIKAVIPYQTFYDWNIFSLHHFNSEKFAKTMTWCKLFHLLTTRWRCCSTSCLKLAGWWLLRLHLSLSVTECKCLNTLHKVAFNKRLFPSVYSMCANIWFWVVWEELIGLLDKCPCVFSFHPNRLACWNLINWPVKLKSDQIALSADRKSVV